MCFGISLKLSVPEVVSSPADGKSSNHNHKVCSSLGFGHRPPSLILTSLHDCRIGLHHALIFMTSHVYRLCITSVSFMFQHRFKIIDSLLIFMISNRQGEKAIFKLKTSFSECLLRTFFICRTDWGRLRPQTSFFFKEGETWVFPFTTRSVPKHLSLQEPGGAQRSRAEDLSGCASQLQSVLLLLQEASTFSSGLSSGCQSSTSTCPWAAPFFSFRCVPFRRCSALNSSSCSSLFRTQESGVLLSVRCVVRRRRHWIGRRWRPQGGRAIMGLRGFCGQVKTEVKLST